MCKRGYSVYLYYCTLCTAMISGKHPSRPLYSLFVSNKKWRSFWGWRRWKIIRGQSTTCYSHTGIWLRYPRQALTTQIQQCFILARPQLETFVCFITEQTKRPRQHKLHERVFGLQDLTTCGTRTWREWHHIVIYTWMGRSLTLLKNLNILGLS